MDSTHRDSAVSPLGPETIKNLDHSRNRAKPGVSGVG